MITNYLFGYAAFLGGMLLYNLSKIADYKKTAKSNPNPALVFSLSQYWDDEWINVVKMLVSGIALVIFLPMMIKGQSVSFLNSQGISVATVQLETVLLPAYFFIAYSGNSAISALFGKYKKTFLNQLGVDEQDK